MLTVQASDLLIGEEVVHPECSVPPEGAVFRVDGLVVFPVQDVDGLLVVVLGAVRVEEGQGQVVVMSWRGSGGHHTPGSSSHPGQYILHCSIK